MDRRPEARVRRVLVALDASTVSPATVRTAADLAARWQAGLIGLFVEDIDLLHAVRMPFAREIGIFSTGLRRLESEELERQMRAQARWMREVLAREAGSRNLSWTFRVRRGPVTAEVMAAGEDADLMVLGRVGRSFRGPLHLGSTVRGVILRRPGLTLVLESRQLWEEPIGLLFDGSAVSHKALEAACELADDQDSPLTIHIVAQDAAEADRLRKEASGAARRLGRPVFCRVYRQPRPEAFAWRLQLETKGPLVIPCGDKPVLQGEGLCTLVRRLPHSVLLVR